MKKFIVYGSMLVLTGSVVPPVLAQKIDKSAKPAPGPVKEFKLPKYSETKLKNGIKVIVVPDKRTPTFSMTYSITPGDIADIKKGTASLVGDLLAKGAGKRSALEIAQLLDGIGASVGASSSGESFSVSGSGLKKHFNTILEVFADVVRRPTMPQDEFEKLIPQYIANIKSNKGSAGELISNISRMVSYGADHPYAARMTEESVQSIVLEDVKQMYNQIFRPNGATIAVIGDVSEKEVVTALEKYFGDWEAKKAPEIVVPPVKPMPKGIYFVERPSATQSYTLLVGTTVERKHPDYFKINMLANVLGAGFGSRLYNTIREKYAFAYGAVAYQSGAKVGNRFAAGAEVRTSATDSTINVVTEELRRLGNEPIPASELNSNNQKMVGGYFLGLEEPGTVADYILSSDIFGIPLEYYTKYPQNVMNTTPAELQRVAKQYLNPDNMSVVIVGNPEALKQLEKYGTINRYTLDLYPVEEDGGANVSVTAEQLIQEYVKALGGEPAIASIKTLVAEGKVEFSMGPQKMQGSQIEKYKDGDKFLMEMKSPMFVQKMMINGDKGYQAQGPQKMELEGSDLLEAKARAGIVPVLKALQLGGTVKVVGERAGSIMATLSMPGGSQQTLYFDAKTKLLTKTIQSRESPQGTMEIIQEFSDYTDVAGVKMPTTVASDINGMFGIKIKNTYKPNVAVEDGEFK